MTEPWIDLLGLTLVIAFGFLAAVGFYQSLSTRDVLVGRVRRLTQRVSRRRWVLGLSYAVTVLIGIPFLIAVWTLVLEVALSIVSADDRLDEVAVIAVAMVASARVLAYVHERTAHELAKVVPLALMLLFLTGGNLELDDRFGALDALDGVDVSDDMLMFLVVLEISMRVITDGSHLLRSEIRQRRQRLGSGRS